MVILKAGGCVVADSSVSCPSPKGSTVGPKRSLRDRVEKCAGDFKVKKTKTKKNKKEHIRSFLLSFGERLCR